MPDRGKVSGTMPDYSGTWQFNPARSELEIEPPDSTVFVIEHHEPHFRLERTHVLGGKSDTFAVELTTDGQPMILHHSGWEIEARLYWEGQRLVFHSSLTREGEQGSNVVRYSLADDGRTFIAEEQFRSARHSYANRWVFDKP